MRSGCVAANFIKGCVLQNLSDEKGDPQTKRAKRLHYLRGVVDENPTKS